MKKSLSIIIVLGILLSRQTAQAYFQDIGAGVRPLGMGGAYVGIADDANAAFWNVAGLSQIQRKEISSMYSTLYSGLNAKLYSGETDRLGHHFLSYVYPLSKEGNTLGLSWMAFDSMFYDENTFALSYARKLNQKLSLGLNLKMLNWEVKGTEYTVNDPLIGGGTSETGFTADLGILYKTGGRFSLGLSGENLIPLDMGVSLKERIPLNLRLGIASKFGEFGILKETTIASDVTYRDREVNKKKDLNFHFGLESWLFQKKFGLRMGGNLDEISGGLSFRRTFGGLELQLDYAFISPFRLEETGGTHRFATVMRFGHSEPTSRPPADKAGQIEKGTPDLKIVGRNKVKDSPEVATPDVRTVKRRKLRNGFRGRVLMIDSGKSVFISFPRKTRLKEGSILGVCNGKREVIAELEVTDISYYPAEPEKMLVEARILTEENLQRIKEGDRVGVIRYKKSSLRARR